MVQSRARTCHASLQVDAADADTTTTTSQAPPAQVSAFDVELNSKNDPSLGVPPLVFDAFIQMARASAMVDTGATTNFISRSFALSNGFKPQPIDALRVRLATGQISMCDSTVLVPVKIGRYRDTLSFVFARHARL